MISRLSFAKRSQTGTDGDELIADWLRNGLEERPLRLFDSPFFLLLSPPKVGVRPPLPLGELLDSVTTKAAVDDDGVELAGLGARLREIFRLDDFFKFGLNVHPSSSWSAFSFFTLSIFFFRSWD